MLARWRWLAKIPADRRALALLPGFGQHRVVRTWLPSLLVLGLLLAVLGCRDAPPYIDPSRYDQAARTTGGPRPRLFARTLPTRERPPEALVADALQLGWICLDLPKKPRPRLLPMQGDGKLRVIERDDGAGWQVLAVDLATRTATVEVALPDWRAEPVGENWLVGTAAAATLSNDDALALAIDVSASMDRNSLGTLQLWSRGAAVELAPAATQIDSFVADAGSQTAWFVDAPPDATATLWQVNLAGPPTPVLLGGAEHVWGVVNDGRLLVIRGQGDKGSETQLFEPASGRRWRAGPDATEVVVAANRIFLQDGQRQLWTVGEWPIEEVPLPGSRRGDRLLAGGGEAAVVRTFPGPVEQLAWIEPTTLLSVGSLGPAHWVAATPMSDGVVAAVVGHDSNGSGTLDPATDEADVCIVARALRPLTVPERTMPHGANLEGLPGATLHVARARPAGEQAQAGVPVLLAALQLPSAASLTTVATVQLACGEGGQQTRYVRAVAMDSRQWRDLCAAPSQPRWLPEDWLHPAWSVGENVTAGPAEPSAEVVARSSEGNGRRARKAGGRGAPKPALRHDVAPGQDTPTKP